MADCDQVAQAVLHAERGHHRLAEKLAAAQAVDVHAAPRGVLLECGHAVNLGEDAVANGLGDNAHVLGLVVGAGVDVCHCRRAIEEGNRNAVSKGALGGVELPVAGDCVVRRAAAKERDAANHVRDALDVVLLLGGGGGHEVVERRLVLACGLHGLARDLLAKLDGVLGGIRLGAGGNAHGHRGVIEGHRAQKAVAAGEACRRDDAREGGVANHRHARELLRKLVEHRWEVIGAARIGKEHLRACHVLVLRTELAHGLLDGLTRIQIAAFPDTCLEHNVLPTLDKGPNPNLMPDGTKPGFVVGGGCATVRKGWFRQVGMRR